MFDIGLPEFMVLAIVAMFVFGPDRLPDVARQAGRLLRQARNMLTRRGRRSPTSSARSSPTSTCAT